MRTCLLSFMAFLLCTIAGAEAPLFDYREATLENGLRVVTLEDFSAPVVAVQLWYHVGSKDERADRQGFAHMFEHMMFQGTDRMGPTGHFDAIHRVGGDCNAYTSFDQTVYVEKLPANQLDLALYLEGERMAFLRIDQTSFDTERKVVEEERRMGLNQPYGSIYEKILAELFHVHPYRWSPIGRIPHLRAAATSELRDFWTRYYVPNNAVLVIAGAAKHEDALALAKKRLGWIPRGPEPPRVSARESDDVHSPAGRAVTIQEANAPAPLVGVLFRTVPARHPDYLSLRLLATILGGGESSRLYRDLIAGRSLAVFAQAMAFSLEDDGGFGAGAALAPLGGDGAKVLEAVSGHLEKLRAEPVTEGELQKAKNHLRRELVTQNLTVERKAGFLGEKAVVEGDLAGANRALALLAAVTAADLQGAAKRYLAPERAVRITVERNLLGALFGKKGEEEGKITAEPEKAAPPPGRAGASRPEGYPSAPPAGAPLDFDPTPRFEERRLPNGLRVLCIANHEVPFVTIQLGLLDGAFSEAKPGVASLALQMLTQGTSKHTEGELSSELESHAIDLGGSAGLDSASVTASCLAEEAERALGLLAEAVRSPVFPEKELVRLKTQVRTGLAIELGDPKHLADRELRRRLYGSHPYARAASGEAAEVDAVSAEDLKSWWKAHARPDRAVLIVSGDLTVDRAAALAAAALGDWRAGELPPGGPPPESTLAAPPPPAPTRIYLVDRPGSLQSEIRAAGLGLTRRDPGYPVARLLSEYFGGAFGSRLNERIRVKKGLTYGASGGLRAQRFLGEFRASTFTKTESTAETLRALLEEIRGLAAEPPSEREIEDARAHLLGSFALERETPQDVARDLWLIETNGLPAGFYRDFLRSVAGAKGEDCARVARSAVDPAKLVIVVVGDASKVQASLEAIAPVTMVKPGGSEEKK